LDFYVNNVKPLYTNTEWGFPKGRKIRGESDEDCALREFCEETGYTKLDIKLINCVNPIVENIVGTNGVSYRHIYYLAELISDKIPSIAQNVEIGNIGLFTRDEAIQMIREYHLEKKDIIRVTFLYYFDMISRTLNTNYNKDEIISEQNIITNEISSDSIKNIPGWSLETDDF